MQETCDQVLVMKNGELQESGNVESIFYSPQADYTKELLEKSKEINLDEQQKYSETQDANIRTVWLSRQSKVNFVLLKRRFFQQKTY